MLKLKRLKISKFRHVEPTELVFDDRYNVPLGINGSGKTTLLKLISACLRSDFSGFKGEEFDVEYELGSLLVHVRNHRPHTTEAGITSSTQPTLHTSLDRTLRSIFRSTAIVTLPTADGSSLVTRSHQGILYFKVNGQPEEEASSDVASPTEGHFLKYHLDSAFEQARKKSLAQVENFWWPRSRYNEECYRFDESLETFCAIVGKSEGDAATPPMASFEIVLHPKKSSPQYLRFIFVPEALLDEVYDAPRETVESGSVTVGAERVPFFETFLKAARFSRGQIVFNLKSAERSTESSTFSFSDVAFRLHTSGGSTITHELLSYGQKRLLSFLYYVACNDTFVVADELVNGLHHDWIEVCLDAIGERQAFLTSQNPILLDFIPPTSPEEARRRFIRCVPKEGEGRDVMTWRNLTREEAEELCANYAAGVQHLSDLLRIQGLW